MKNTNMTQPTHPSVAVKWYKIIKFTSTIHSMSKSNIERNPITGRGHFLLQLAIFHWFLLIYISKRKLCSIYVHQRKVN